MASTRSPTWTSLRSLRAMVGKLSPFTSIFSTAMSARASSSSTLAGSWRRSHSTTCTSWPPAITWWLVTITPSERTMAPEPSDCSTPGRALRPNICQKGSACWRTTRRLNTLTTAGAAFLTTGAKDMRMAPPLSGMRRSGAANPPWTPWALDLPGWPEQAARTLKARTGISKRRRLMWRSAPVKRRREISVSFAAQAWRVRSSRVGAGPATRGKRRSSG